MAMISSYSPSCSNISSSKCVNSVIGASEPSRFALASTGGFLAPRCRPANDNLKKKKMPTLNKSVWVLIQKLHINFYRYGVRRKLILREILNLSNH